MSRMVVSQGSGSFRFPASAASTMAFPGQPGNPVGHTATPASAPALFATLNGQSWPGAFSSLTAWPGGTGAQTLSGGTSATSGAGTSGNPWIFAFRDFDALTSGTLLSLSNAIFVGCRFQSNNTTNYNLRITGANVHLLYCTLAPRAALVASPPNDAWPSASAGLQIHYGSAGYNDSGSYCTPTASSYQYGIQLDAVTGVCNVDHCEFFGYGNSITFLATTVQINITNNRIANPANTVATPPGQAGPYHVDGPGYLNAATPPQNILIQGNVIAGISNSNAIAFQAASSGYSNISVIGNYLTGFNQTVDMCHNAAGNNNLTFTDNIIATDIPWVDWNGSSVVGGKPIYADFSAQFTSSTNLWRRNKFKVAAGTSQVSGTSLTWVSGDDGKFVLPTGALSASDWAN